MPRRPDDIRAEKVFFPKEQASTAATLTLKVFKVPPNKKFRLDSVHYNNVTGLAANAANFFVGTIKNGATVAATVFNTNSVGGAAIAADTPTYGTLSGTDSARIFNAGDVLLFVATLTGTQTLPAGTLVLEGRFF